MTPLLSPAAGEFLAMQIRSLLQLKVLLLHHHSSQWWSARDAAMALHAGPEAVGRALEQLAGNLLDVRIADRVLYRFSPTDRAVVSLIDEVSDAHQRAPGLVEAAAAGVQRVARRRTGRAR